MLYFNTYYWCLMRPMECFVAPCNKAFGQNAGCRVVGVTTGKLWVTSAGVNPSANYSVLLLTLNSNISPTNPNFTNSSYPPTSPHFQPRTCIPHTTHCHTRIPACPHVTKILLLLPGRCQLGGRAISHHSLS